MERLCEDERMCIQKYAPMAEIGVSNERLYNEIKLLDPTFDMARLYYDLVRWREVMAILKTEYHPYHTYDVLSQYHVSEIYETREKGVYVIDVWEEDADPMIEGLSGRGHRVLSHKQSTIGREVSVKLNWTSDMGTKLTEIERAMLLHPLRNIEFMANGTRNGGMYEPRTYLLRERTYTPDLAYDHALYMAIREVDPTIDMNIIYDVYMRKHQREYAVRDMYEVWRPHLFSIEKVGISDDQVEIGYHDMNTLDDLPEMYGWVHESSSWVYKYDGPDPRGMYDKILTMLRMYYSYSVPYVESMGVSYYSTYW
jgi:hypothetical protein